MKVKASRGWGHGALAWPLLAPQQLRSAPLIPRGLQSPRPSCSPQRSGPVSRTLLRFRHSGFADTGMTSPDSVSSPRPPSRPAPSQSLGSPGHALSACQFRGNSGKMPVTPGRPCPSRSLGAVVRSECPQPRPGGRRPASRWRRKRKWGRGRACCCSRLSASPVPEWGVGGRHRVSSGALASWVPVSTEAETTNVCF